MDAYPFATCAVGWKDDADKATFSEHAMKALELVTKDGLPSALMFHSYFMHTDALVLEGGYHHGFPATVVSYLNFALAAASYLDGGVDEERETKCAALSKGSASDDKVGDFLRAAREDSHIVLVSSPLPRAPCMQGLQ